MDFDASRRLMVDMSATIIHHGHIRLLAKANQIGSVIVGLATDDEVLKWKGYVPELAFEHRKEILASIRYVSDVVASPWLIDEAHLDRHNIDYLVHGDDCANPVPRERQLIFARTENISSSIIRDRTLKLCPNSGGRLRFAV